MMLDRTLAGPVQSRSRWDGCSLRFLLSVVRLLQNQGRDPITISLIDCFDSPAEATPVMTRASTADTGWA